MKIARWWFRGHKDVITLHISVLMSFAICAVTNGQDMITDATKTMLKYKQQHTRVYFSREEAVIVVIVGRKHADRHVS